MTMPSGTTNQEVPSQVEPFVFPSFGNVGPPLMDTLSLPKQTIGLPVWLFSILIIPTPPYVSDVNYPSREHQPLVDHPSLFLGVSSPISPSSPIESCSTSNQMNKNKKKTNIKNNKGWPLTES